MFLSFIIKTFFFQSFWIPSTSMEPTLDVGDRILVTKWRPGPMDLRRGDVVVFSDPNHWLGYVPPSRSSGWFSDLLSFVGLMPEDSGEHLVKRVIGLPGDTVACPSLDGPVYVNGDPIVEPYVPAGLAGCSPTGNEGTWSITVPEGRVWVMGDNRTGSSDSRAHMDEPGGGTIPIDDIVGAAFVKVWPISRWGGIGNPLAAAEAAGSAG